MSRDFSAADLAKLPEDDRFQAFLDNTIVDWLGGIYPKLHRYGGSSTAPIMAVEMLQLLPPRDRALAFRTVLGSRGFQENGSVSGQRAFEIEGLAALEPADRFAAYKSVMRSSKFFDNQQRSPEHQALFVEEAVNLLPRKERMDAFWATVSELYFAGEQPASVRLRMMEAFADYFTSDNVLKPHAPYKETFEAVARGEFAVFKSGELNWNGNRFGLSKLYMLATSAQSIGYDQGQGKLFRFGEAHWPEGAAMKKDQPAPDIRPQVAVTLDRLLDEQLARHVSSRVPDGVVEKMRRDFTLVAPEGTDSEICQVINDKLEVNIRGPELDIGMFVGRPGVTYA